MALTYTASGDGEILVGKILARIKAEGGEHSGDAGCGEFSIQGFCGTYRVEGGKLTLAVTKKPVFVPDAMIEAWLRQHLE